MAQISARRNADKNDFTSAKSKIEFPAANKEATRKLRDIDGLLYSSAITQIGPVNSNIHSKRK